MLQVSFYNLGFDLRERVRELAGKTSFDPSLPSFDAEKEDIGSLRQALQKFMRYQDILLVGNGGSVVSFLCYFSALGGLKSPVRTFTLTDMEPAYLELVKERFTPSDTLVIVVSKSGSTVGVIELLLFFSGYPMLFVTESGSALAKIAARKGVDIIPHPPVEGRFSGFTSSAYVPSIIAGLAVEEIERGGRGGYDMWRTPSSEENSAFEIAAAFYELETRGYIEVFLPIYSNFLHGFGMVATQLFHETFGKEEKGVTVLAAPAPESHHHTNQRFLGGRKNMFGCFLHVRPRGSSSSSIRVPPEVADIPIRAGRMADLDGVDLEDSFASEYRAAFGEAQKRGIPLVDIALPEISGKSIGELMAFFHYAAFFGAVLRGVNPFDQPEVEAAKDISFELRLLKKKTEKNFHG
jgi:glucose-6-phosphate isomerase